MWKNEQPENIDIREALADMAPRSAINFDPSGLELKIVDPSGREYSRSMRNYDPILRWGMWILVVPLLLGMEWANRHPILPAFGTVALAALLFGGAGTALFFNLTSGFNSRTVQVAKRAKAAIPKEEIIMEMIALYWSLRHTRPPFAVVVNPIVAWGNEDNNLNLQTLLPLKKAMIWAAENAHLDWKDRSYIQEHLRDVENALGTVGSVWGRWTWLPAFVHVGAFLCGAVFTVWALLVPILVRF